jgi:3'-phosphoadenosine 5'-phosphosulfate sulfotransferase (PAPS reductase)/FAD synthetase
MTSREPRLTEEDERVWNSWCATWSIHARSRSYLRRVDTARLRVRETFLASKAPVVAFSGGKDSRVMLELIEQEASSMGVDYEIFSHKDDCDYPGEIDYVRREASNYKRQFTVLAPPFSVAAWMHDNAKGGDLHSRASGLSKAAFYDVVDAFTSRFDVSFLGLRQDESRARRMNRAVRGVFYTKKNGVAISTPIVDWSGNDVFAFALQNKLELLPIYKCLAFIHSAEPWRIREAWWLPQEDTARYGGVAWLRHYYPSLYRQLRDWMPQVQSLT